MVHSRNGYYNDTIIHRVIRGFMVQMGDPKGDGTGGTSIWGHDFEDEFDRDLRHDRPFTVRYVLEFYPCCIRVVVYAILADIRVNRRKRIHDDLSALFLFLFFCFLSLLLLLLFFFLS